MASPFFYLLHNCISGLPPFSPAIRAYYSRSDEEVDCGGRGELGSCFDDLWKGELRTVNDVREKVLRVKAYVRSRGEFLARHGVVIWRFRGEIGVRFDWGSEILCLSALYFFFLLWIIKGICRFVGLKLSPLGKVFRLLFTDKKIVLHRWRNRPLSPAAHANHPPPPAKSFSASALEQLLRNWKGAKIRKIEK